MGKARREFRKPWGREKCAKTENLIITHGTVFFCLLINGVEIED